MYFSTSDSFNFTNFCTTLTNPNPSSVAPRDPPGSNRGGADTCPAVPYQFTPADFNMVKSYDEWNFDDIDGGVWKQGYNIETNDAEWKGRKLKGELVCVCVVNTSWLYRSCHFCCSTSNLY